MNLFPVHYMNLSPPLLPLNYYLLPNYLFPTFAGAMIEFFSEVEGFEPDALMQQGITIIVGQMADDHGMRLISLNYIFLDDEALLEINRQYLQHDYYTDIITFPLADDPEHDLEGEAYISIDRVRENAMDQSVAFELELIRIMIHGALHLCGHVDTSTEQRNEMKSFEDQYITRYVSRETLSNE